MAILYINFTSEYTALSGGLPSEAYINYSVDQDSLGQIVTPFNITYNVGPLDEDTGTYPNSDAARVDWESAAISFLMGQANAYNDDDYDDYEIISVDYPIQKLLDLKQDQSDILDAVSSADVGSGDMLFFTGPASADTVPTTSFGRALLNYADLASLKSALGITAIASAQTTDEGNISTAQTDISGLKSSRTTDESNISSLQSSRTTDEANITAALAGLNRTTSNISPALVGTGATGTQVHASKASTVRIWLNESVTSSIGGAATAIVNVKICATNNATEGSWTTLGTFEEDQTVTLALALQSVQVMKGMLEFDLPAGWYYKAESSGSGTNSESVLSGQQTIYG